MKIASIFDQSETKDMSFAGFYMSPLWAFEISGVSFCCPTIKMTPMGHVTKASSGRPVESKREMRI